MQCSTTALKAAFPRPAGVRRLETARRGLSVVCMAHPRRVAKVAKQIEREVGNLLITDKILQAAVCPERRRGYDGALSALASVTEVTVTNDLQVAKVYLSIYSDEPGKAVAMEGLQRLEGYVRKHIGKQVRLRLTPEIRFVRDDSIERSERIFKLLDQVKKIERGEAEPPPLAFYGDSDDEEEGEDEDDGWEEGLQSVDLGMFGGGDSSDEEEEAPSKAPAAARTQQAGQQQAQQQAQQQQQGPPGRQQQQPGGGGKQRQQQRQQQEGGEEDADLEAMLQQFRAQVEERRRRQ